MYLVIIESTTERNTDSLLAELESLNTPCVMEFRCLIETDEIVLEAKRGIASDDSSKGYDCKLEWVNGKCGKDELHQIVQLMQNWLSKK